MSNRTLGISLALVLLALWLGSNTVSAHAELIRATPSPGQTLSQSPDQIELLFSEALDPAFSSVAVFSSSGSRVDANDSHLDPGNDRLLVVSLRPNLPNDTYVVGWRSLSAIDVHPDDGAYRLFVGVPVSATSQASVSPPTTGTPETTLGRWWFYVAASMFGGVLAAWKVVFTPAFDDAAHLEVAARTRQLVLLGGVLLIVGTLFTAVAQAAAAAGVPLPDAIGRPLSDLLLRGRFATIWWPRMGLEVASLVLVAFGGIDGLAAECALATLPAVLLTSALTSHGASLSIGPIFGVVIDWLHVLGATAWIGGLIGLLLCFAVIRPPWLRVDRLVGNFGRFGLAASGCVLLSGALQGALEVDSWDALTATLYGQLLLIKVALLAMMLLLALINELHARAEKVVPDAIRRGVMFEAGLGVVVFVVAAVLSGTPPSPR